MNFDIFHSNKDEIKEIQSVIKFAHYTNDDLLILATNVGQFTFDVVDCDFSGSGEQILFLFSRKNDNGRVENFDLKIDNSAKYKEKNFEIITEFTAVKKRKIAQQ
ncbi:hypothetical protein [Acinetobacter lwoffii]|uniref:hypothetical protein n=1 Tax=Acinetobacter lwoffii TaxID=28090 RepID=UPI0011DD51BB|nr:hypothetical protein [Acinetobacter lwoffii]